jgi:hypothetical protein
VGGRGGPEAAVYREVKEMQSVIFLADGEENSRGVLFLQEHVSDEHARARRERGPICFRVRRPLPCACRTCILTAALNRRLSIDDEVDGGR